MCESSELAKYCFTLFSFWVQIHQMSSNVKVLNVVDRPVL